MGVNDRRRFRVFAEFIRETYPSIKTVADIAGAHGNVSFHLYQYGYQPTIIDLRDVPMPRRMHWALRKESVKKGRLVNLPKIIGRVQDQDLSPFDLIIGLHADEATEYVVRAAIEFEKDFAVVPCCVFPIDGIKRSRDEWQAYLISLAPDIRTAELPINGSNVVLYRCRTGT